MEVDVYQGDQIQCCFENQQKTKTDYLILDFKKWDFQIWIILLQIKFFEQLAHKGVLTGL